MKYFYLTNSTDEEEIGKAFPQCKGLPSGMGLTYEWLEQQNSMTKLRNDEFPDFEPNLLFELESKAKLTDVISPSNISAKGLLVNEKVKNILEQFRLMEYMVYPATLVYKGTKHEYFWIHFKDCEEKYLSGVDYANSTFFVSNLAFMKQSDIQITSREDFWSKKMNLPMKHIRASKIGLLEQLEAENFDLFYIPFIHSNFLVSERLKEELEEKQIKGLEIKKQEVFL